MTAADIVTQAIRTLRSGQLSLAQLGPGEGEGGETLRLEDGPEMQQYSRLLRRRIVGVLARNRRMEILIVVLLVLMFAACTGLSIAAHVNGWSWEASATPIAGLGVTVAWPIRQLIKLQRQRISLELIPDLVALLTPTEAARILEEHVLKKVT